MRLKISIDRGADTDLLFNFADAAGTPVDLTGYTLRMQVRPAPAARVLFDELSIDNGRLVIESAGTVRATITAEASMSYPLTAAAFDMLATAADGRRTRIAEGTIEASGEVTR